MKNNRKIFSIKEAVAGAHAVDLQINLFSNDFVENELMVYKDPFRVALVSIKQGGSKYNGYSFRADVLHYCGLQMESEQLHFDFILNHENEIQLFTPAIYFNEIQSLFSSHENQILEKYKAHHCSLFPELNQVLGDSKQDWIMYFSLLAVAHGARDKNEVKALFELTNSNFEKKLSQELITKIIDLKECFHPYVLFNGLRLPSVNYFNERLYFLVRNFCSGDALLWKDFETELNHMQSYGFLLSCTKTSITISGLAERSGWKELLHLLAERKQQAIKQQRYNEASLLRDIEREVLNSLHIFNENRFNFFELHDKKLMYKTPADDFLRTLLLLRLGSILNFNN